MLFFPPTSLSFALSFTHAYSTFTQDTVLVNRCRAATYRRPSPIISPVSRSCQHNRQGRITDRSLFLTKKRERKKRTKRGTHHLSFSIMPFLSITTSPLVPPHKAHWVERERKRNGKERGIERHYAYENVLKEVWFMYALDADSITGQWLKWDPSRNIGATWSHSVSLLAMRAAGKLQTEERKGATEGEKKYSRHIYNLDTHTSPTERE